MKRVYISGKIGEEVISDATRLKFDWAEETLRAKGYDVVNPTDGRWQQQLESGYGNRCAENWDYPLTFYAYALLRDLRQLAACDAVYFLDDWGRSPGATAEYYFARAVGKRMFWQDRHDACEYLVERMYAEAKAEGRTIDYDGLLNRSDLEIAYFTKHLDEAWLPIAGKEVEP